jgi:regulator of replication initiation timing
MSATIRELAQTIGEATPDARATIARLIRESDALYTENARLKRELGNARLLADLRRDQAEIAS